MPGDIQKEFDKIKNRADKQIAERESGKKVVIQVGSATCEDAAGSGAVFEEFKKSLEASGRKDILIRQVGCTGSCSREPIVRIIADGDEPVKYESVSADLAHTIFIGHVQGGKPLDQGIVEDGTKVNPKRVRIALRNTGNINPEQIDEYIRNKGFSAIADILAKGEPQFVIDNLKESNLRGRGGGGFPTGMKWEFGYKEQNDTKYIICNADEGDPGAFMDRSMLESDPFSILEGMIIGGFTIGASKGFLYIRAEYPMAIDRITEAIKQCREWGLLGENILGSGFNFDLEIRLGAGAFVCGEETALIHSIEGERGQPRIRPPFPTQSGLWGKPTVINNVETFANIAAIFQMGAKEFAAIGTEKSGGTKVFALAGKVVHTGLAEVPVGTTIREIVYELGGGVPDGKELKAIQTGGPAGGCIPAEFLDTPVDYDTLGKLGSIMGSGGMIVMDEDDCMVDIAKFFLAFSQDESCGKCTPCREGTKRMLEILEKITAGNGVEDDLENLERLANLVQKASLCGLGRAAPNPVLSTVKRFRSEYEAHITDKRCPARKCTKLMTYEVNEKCIGCTACARNCPVNCISGKPKEAHVIDQAACIKCGKCFEVCRFNAITKN